MFFEFGFHPLRLIVTIGLFQAVAFFIIEKGFSEGLAIFQGLAQGETQVEIVFLCTGALVDLRAHGLDIVGVKAKCLQIRKTPVSITKAGLQADGLPVCRDGFVLLADGL